MKFYLQNFNLIFLLIALGDLAGRLIESRTMDFICKPLIMLSLLFFFFGKANNHSPKLNNLLVGAIIASWFGDVFLMFEPPIFFQLGLGSFLIAQIFYILVFYHSVSITSGQGFLKRNFYWVLPYFLFWVLMNYILFPKAGEVAIPVMVYSATLITMSIMALNRYQSVSYSSAHWVYIGSVLFVFSDMLIAINKFLFQGQIFIAGFLIMLTYIIAQYMIIKGMVLEMKLAREA
jgi:uncharacterized membrane protein YhhN